jgi:cyclopropane fatty-acyl-phospholipid synthase-like methyltransferase
LGFLQAAQAICLIATIATNAMRLPLAAIHDECRAMTKPFSPACERNSAPILAVLRGVLRHRTRILEIGSGTGQHAVHFASHLPHLQWHTSDLAENHPGIHAWLEEAALDNVAPPVVLDMQAPDWPDIAFDAAFTANTAHIMAWPQVETMFAGIAARLPPDGLFCVYGPFNYEGRFTGQGNADFDAALWAAAPHRGLRDIEAVTSLAGEQGLVLQADNAMPSDNRLLVFARAAA